MSTVLAALLAAAGPAAYASPAAAAPSCAEGPQRVGATIYGTPCADTIHASPGVTAVYGEGGDDTIYGGRSNQSLYGGPGNDRLYGGIGDDRLRGGPGDDLLSGGFGADSLDGEGGSDYARGDATIDAIGDSGSAADTDTLSYATGATPGFFNNPAKGYPDFSAYAAFPAVGGERGVYVDLTKGIGDNGVAPTGGGVDEEVDGTSFETVIGTPFSDYIVGTSHDETIYGGGGADVILGEGGQDHIYGGADGDYCDEEEGTIDSCEFGAGEEEVAPRDPSKVSVGLVSTPGADPPTIYLDGSNGLDEVAATFSEPPGESRRVTLELLGGSTATFDGGASVDGGCNPPGSSEVVCPVTEAPDSVVLAGLGGDDSLSVHGFPPTTSIVELGGDGGDYLAGSEAEDVLVDGSGNDDVSAAGGDDALPNNQGEDTLSAGAGNDLFISDAVCEGDTLDGGAGVDNANWAKFGSPVSLDLAAHAAERLDAGGHPDCAGDPVTTLSRLEDVEGSNFDDTLIGDSGENQLLGRPGSDSYHAGAGNDSILANSGDSDAVIDCGEGFDTAQIDIPTHNETEDFEDPAPIGCEAVFERPPNSFRPPQTPPGPEPESEPVPQAPPAATPIAPPHDAIPPRTRILHRPHRTVFARGRRRAVVFAFASNEPGSRFRCRLDRGRFRPCRSPRRYRIRPGRHTFRVFAIDAAGNRDRTPAVFRFRVRRLSVHSSRSHHRRGSTR